MLGCHGARLEGIMASQITEDDCGLVDGLSVEGYEAVM